MKVLLVPSFSLSLITNIFLFLIPAVTPQVVEDDYYLECSKSYKCGSITDIKYPFWGSDRPSYCGLQGYEFKCTNYLIFNMSSQLFVVHKIERSSSTMTIARKDWLENNCSSYFVKTVMNFTLVDYGPGAEVLTLFDSCPSEFSGIVEPREKLICEDNYGIVPLKNTVWFDASQMCKNNVTIPVLPETKEGFENNTLPLLDLMKNGFEVDYERQANMITCHNCEKSGGICGTNTTTYDFTCFCKDGPHSFSCRGSFSKKPIVKISIIFGLSVIGAVLSLFWVWYLNKVLINKINKRRKEKFFKQNGGLLLQQQLLSGDNNIEKIKVFKSYELAKATNFYDMDRVLGQGGQGTVYKGMLSDGRLVAVKKSKIVDTTNIEQFINEVVILSQINHRNIVKLLGCCLETEVPMLVYEFISNGTLFQHIHNPIEEFTLTWKVRLQIAMEIAETLSYLHNAASMPIYHRDIKSTNILLDDKYKAKVSDFGISRSVDVEKNHLTTEVKGTFGYLDPEYFQSSQFTEKSDVYSFGVVLVELLTGKQPIFSNTSQIFRGLAPHFIELMEDNHLLEMIDPKLLMEDTIEDMVEVAHLAKACLNSNGKRRPTTKEIVAKLDVIRASQKQSITLEKDETNDVREVYDNSSTSPGTWDQSSSEMSIDLSNLK